MKKRQPKPKSELTVLSALKYFLKGNMAFAIAGIVVYVINLAVCILPPFFQQVYTDNIITHKNPEWFTPLLVLYFMLFILEMIAWVSLSIVRRMTSTKLIISMSSKYLWTVLRLPMTAISRFSPGELVARYMGITKTVRALDINLPSLVIFFVPVLCCTLIMYMNWKLGIVQLLSIVLLLYVMRSTSKVQKKISMNLEVTESRLQNVTMTGLGNMETIKSLGGEQFFFSQWDQAYVQAMNARVKTSTNTIFLSAVPLLVLHLTNAVILCVGAWFILRGELTPGMLLASQGLANESIWPINKTIDGTMMMMRVNSSIKRIKDVTDCGSEGAGNAASTDSGIAAADSTVIPTAPHIASISVEGVRAEVLLHALEEKGVYVSAGSACASNKPAISETLKAIGLKKELLDSTIRFSLSIFTTEEEIRYAVASVFEILDMLRKYTRR